MSHCGGLVAPRRCFERDRAGDDAAIDLGQGHVHGDIARAEAAACRARQAASAPPAKITCSTGQSDAAKGESWRRCRVGDGEAGGVEHHVGRHGAAAARTTVAAASGSLRLATKIGSTFEAARAERGDESVDGCRVARLHQGAIDRRAPPGAGRRRGARATSSSVDVRRDRARPAAAAPARASRSRGRSASAAKRRNCSALATPPWTRILPQPMGGFGRARSSAWPDRRRADRRRAGTRPECCARGRRRSPARRHRSNSRARRAGAPRPAALGDHLLDIEIDRERVAQAHQIGEAQG